MSLIIIIRILIWIIFLYSTVLTSLQILRDKGGSHLSSTCYAVGCKWTLNVSEVVETLKTLCSSSSTCPCHQALRCEVEAICWHWQITEFLDIYCPQWRNTALGTRWLKHNDLLDLKQLPFPCFFFFFNCSITAKSLYIYLESNRDVFEESKLFFHHDRCFTTDTIIHIMIFITCKVQQF